MQMKQSWKYWNWKRVKMMFYQFENDRKYDRASDYLEGFNGVIQSDGYQAYANIKDIKKHGMFCSS